MFSYSMIQMVRGNTNKVDKELRNQILKLHRPFKRTPCFLHKLLEGSFKRLRKLPLVIEFEHGQHHAGCSEVRQVTDRGIRHKFRHEFPRISCCSVDVTPKGLEDLLASCHSIKRVYMNRKVHALLDVATDTINARDIVYNDTELTGENVSIAIIDTGIHPHQDLSGRIKAFADLVDDQTEPYDDNGHGTHCAGDAAGDGAASSGQYRAPAHQADLIGVKVLNKMGSGSLETVMRGVEWCIQYNENNPDDPIDVISMSLGSDPGSYNNEDDDPMVKVVEKAWEAGIVMCVAAGNSGPEPQSIASPGVSDQVITVGALDDQDTAETRDDDTVAEFSGRGPTVYGKVKPDILAPGVDIVSLRAPNSYLDKTQSGSRVENDYFMLSGTSMATPICAGAVALMKQAYPDASPDELKDLLKNGADVWTDKDPNVYGAGYLNVENTIGE
ncbi:S8 family peptidase [Lentibacillus sp. CBA3610]|uniref:S8 family peptidase n=1 Tax=Lentibacillus sp. CBA3610 TaxID=2518176 RepID=UPI0015953BEE|nr:S8 family peptidase [Lentibacillus sp. CBA3610]QKY70799.1 serine protease [Lentibacillus sp. CBA3610]